MDFSTRAEHILNGPAWHGRSTMELLKGLTPEQAIQRPAEGVHSVAELVGHMLAWRDWGLHMVNGDLDFKIQMNGPVDWPQFETLNSGEWEAMLSRLREQMEQLKAKVAAMTDEQLDSPVGERPFNYRYAIQFLLDHDIYHGGQIAVARKLINAPYPPDDV